VLDSKTNQHVYLNINRNQQRRRCGIESKEIEDMNWKVKLKNLLSRKFLLALIGAASGLAIALGADADFVQVLVGAATALVSVVSYIVMEGKVDSEAVTLASEFVQQVIIAVEAAKEQKEPEDGKGEMQGGAE
jgi:phage shock protein PspC (stress-responsive transcriptional regulator)